MEYAAGVSLMKNQYSTGKNTISNNHNYSDYNKTMEERSNREMKSIVNSNHHQQQQQQQQENYHHQRRHLSPPAYHHHNYPYKWHRHHSQRYNPYYNNYNNNNKNHGYSNDNHSGKRKIYNDKNNTTRNYNKKYELDKSYHQSIENIKGTPCNKTKLHRHDDNSSSDEKRDIRWIYPNIYTIIEKLRYNKSLEAIRHRLENKYNNDFLLDYFEETKEDATKVSNYIDKDDKRHRDNNNDDDDEKVREFGKLLDSQLLDLFTNFFVYILKTYNEILACGEPESQTIDRYKRFYIIFMKHLNDSIDDLRTHLNTSYEKWIKNLISKYILEEQNKDTEQGTIDNLEKRLLYIALFDYYHPTRTQDGKFTYSRDMYYLVD